MNMEQLENGCLKIWLDEPDMQEMGLYCIDGTYSEDRQPSAAFARLEELHLDDTKYWLITGGAMVLYGLREQTSDIDLGCTSNLANLLQQEGFPVERMPDGTRKIVVAEDVEIFENWLEDKVERFEGVPVISIRGLIEMKRALGRGSREVLSSFTGSASHIS